MKVKTMSADLLSAVWDLNKPSVVRFVARNKVKREQAVLLALAVARAQRLRASFDKMRSAQTTPMRRAAWPIFAHFVSLPAVRELWLPVDGPVARAVAEAEVRESNDDACTETPADTRWDSWPMARQRSHESAPQRRSARRSIRSSILRPSKASWKTTSRS